MIIRELNHSDKSSLINLIKEFRMYLSALKGVNRIVSTEDAENELDSYSKPLYPIFVAESESKIVGYLVLKIDDDIVWIESLYVKEYHRQKGIGSKLFAKAEEIMKEHQGLTLYNWVHPNNEKMISFLRKHGYNVLNLIEIRKKRPNENIQATISVGNNDFRY